MAKHHILCVHGLGKHENNWVKSKDDLNLSFEELLKELWSTYAPSSKKFDANVKLHSIHYDDEINKIFKSWEDQVKSLKEGLASSPMLMNDLQWYTDTIDNASEAQQGGDWQYTHLFDLLLFVGSPSIQDRLVNYVGKQIIELIEKYRKDDYISLIGHSMGTAMSHKAIQALYNEVVTMSDGSKHTLKGDFRFQSVSMIANTSYTLSRNKPNHYNGICRPTMTVGEGCCDKWFNINHKLDPVGQFLPFNYRKNPNWLDPMTQALGWHHDIELSAISSQNIHSINHYFRDPVFHLPFFENTFGIKISQKKKEKAINAFKETTIEGKFKTLKSHLEAIDVSNADSFKTFYGSVKKYSDLIKQFTI